MWTKGQERITRETIAAAKLERDVVEGAVFEAVTDVLALFKVGGKPLLKKKRKRRDTKPGLTGAALEKAVDRFAANPLYAGRVH